MIQTTKRSEPWQMLTVVGVDRPGRWDEAGHYHAEALAST